MAPAREMRLLGFNTGSVRAQLIDGELVRTGYVKSTVPEPWVITSRGAEGDEVAVHADHLYAFDRESYDHWARELGADRNTWADGHFAENLTLDTLDQSELRIGDVFRVGGAVLIVTGPRVPCWKLTWRLGQPKTFMRTFRLSGRSGVYLGVLEPGVVAPGDPFVLLHRDAANPSVAELSALCDSGTRISPHDRATIERALASPNLSPTVRSTLTLKVANLDGEDGPLAWSGWRRFDVDGVDAEAGEAVSVRLRPRDGGVLPRFDAGQHVVVRIGEPGGTPVVRTWSLSDWARRPDHFRITVKLREQGRGSSALARASTNEPSVELRAPAGRFRLDRGSFRPVVLVAAGIGITPMMAMITAHLDRDVHTPPLWLLYGTPDPDGTTFRDELDELFAAHDDLRLHFFHSRGDFSPRRTRHGAPIHHGRITAQRIVEVLRDNYLPTPDGPAAIPWFESDVYLCGPIGFTTSIRDGLVAAGANPDHVFAEDFAAASSIPMAPRRGTDATVDFASTGVSATWFAARERTLLELGEDNGLRLPFDCRSGSCRTCEARVLDGQVHGAVRSTPDGYVRALLCSSYPLSDRVVLEAPTE